MGDLSTALAIAARVHHGQTDKSGRPYLAHPLRMVAYALTSGRGDDVAIVAALHDVLEDGEETSHGLREKGFSSAVCRAVEDLTRRAGEEYEHYLRRVMQNPLAHIVKRIDVADNMDPARIALISEEGERRRLQLKYIKAKDILWGFEEKSHVR